MTTWIDAREDPNPKRLIELAIAFYEGKPIDPRDMPAALKSYQAAVKAGFFPKPQ